MTALHERSRMGACAASAPDDEALAEVARVLPHTRLKGSTYAGSAGAPVLLLRARLLARATPAPADEEGRLSPFARDRLAKLRRSLR